MVITGLTDIHGRFFLSSSFVERVKGSDLVLLGGDITHFGNPRDVEPFLEELTSYNSSVAAVAGNCDSPEIEDFLRSKDVGIHGVCRRVGMYTILGLGGSLPAPVHTPYTFSETEYQDILGRIAGQCSDCPDIIVSHQPPHKTKLDRAMGFRHVGSRVLREYIEQCRPKLVFCGHIHESSGTDTFGNTTLLNPGPFRHGNYAVITMDDRKISVELCRT